jgi:hypothetical protein
MALSLYTLRAGKVFLFTAITLLGPGSLPWQTFDLILAALVAFDEIKSPFLGSGWLVLQ